MNENKTSSLGFAAPKIELLLLLSSVDLFSAGLVEPLGIRFILGRPEELDGAEEGIASLSGRLSL